MIQVDCGDDNNGGRPYSMMIRAIIFDRDIGSCVCV